jgi:DNA-binding response OmpR family regulator
MQEMAELGGQRVLLVEDNFLIASDTADLLTRAGAEVIGPSASAEEARAMLAASHPTLAVLDLNLGEGCPRFDLARLVSDRGIPLLILSGYDREVAPSEFADAEWLQKPTQARQIIEAARRLCRTAH